LNEKLSNLRLKAIIYMSNNLSSWPEANASIGQASACCGYRWEQVNNTYQLKQTKDNVTDVITKQDVDSYFTAIESFEMNETMRSIILFDYKDKHNLDFKRIGVRQVGESLVVLMHDNGRIHSSYLLVAVDEYKRVF